MFSSLLVSPCATPSAFMTPGFLELVVVATVALLIYGGDLPDVMRTLGRAYGKLRGNVRDFSRPVRDEFQRVSNSARETLRESAHPRIQSSKPPSETTDNPPPRDEEASSSRDAEYDWEHAPDDAESGHGPMEERPDTDSPNTASGVDSDDDFDDPPMV